jgi:hypothetical protein
LSVADGQVILSRRRRICIFGTVEILRFAQDDAGEAGEAP